MEIKKNLELVDVVYSNSDKKATLTYLDIDAGATYEVSLNKQVWDASASKFHDDEAKAERIENTCMEHFGCIFSDLHSAIGSKHDIYVYDNFSSLTEVAMFAKFEKDMVGICYDTSVKDVVVNEFNIEIQYEIDGATYRSKHTWGKYVESMKKWFDDPQKKKVVYAKFEEKYGVPVEDCKTLIGHPLVVEVKSAFGTNFYGDIKKFPKKKK